MPVGPQKIILVRSGLYEYAEVDLNGAIQIVGPNNTGKSTLIKTLQFLYLNDRRQMDFPYSPEQTREFYFPDQYSYILFECLGVQGLCVIGWRGQNKTSGAEPDRFCHLGPYDESDFFADRRQVREPHEVNAKLALKQFRAIKSAQEHAELLLPPTTAQARGLGIVALRHPDKYHQFRETLKCLLNLSAITQEDMRDRLLMLADIPLDRTALDVRSLFGDDYVRMCNRRDRLLLFQANLAGVKAFVEKVTHRDIVRGELICRYRDLRTRKQSFEKEHQAKLDQLRAEAAACTDTVKRLATELVERHADVASLSEQKGGLAAKISEIAKLDDDFKGFIKEWESAALTNLETAIRTLENQLANAEGESREKARQKVDGCVLLVRQAEQTIARYDNLAVTALRKHFTDDELNTVFRLLSRDLLEIPVAKGGIQVLRQRDLLDSLRELLSRVNDDVYKDANIVVTLPCKTLPLTGLENVESAREKLLEHQETLQRWQKILSAVEHREQLHEELKTKRADHDRARKRLFLFEEFQKTKAAAPTLQAGLEAITEKIETARRRIEVLTTQSNTAAKAEDNSGKAIRKEEDEFDAVMNRFDACDFPEFEAPERPVYDIPNDFDAAIALFLRHQEKQNKLAEEATKLLGELERWSGDEFHGEHERETVRLLREELEALPDKEEAMIREWNAHIHGLKATFDRVLKELNEIHSAKDALNRQFAKVQVSNLRSVRMDVNEHGDLVPWIKRLAAFEPGGLYDKDPERESAVVNFRAKLQGNPIVRFADLFMLGVTVEGPTGRKHTYPDLKKIESDGTTVAVKVMFNLLVLKSQLKRDDCQVPFFLDEIHSLDAANREAIIAMARKLGFLAVTAAPESVGEVDALYYLQPRRGRIVLRNKHCLGIKLKPVQP